ncbi:MAG: peptide deformylase [Pseudomonadota bacterium]
MLPLRFEGDPVLAQVALPVTDFDQALAQLAEGMLETMYDAPGRGLAGPQVGLSQRIFVVDTEWKEGAPAPMVFVNPVIVASSGARADGNEACLSIPDKAYTVSRPLWIDAVWQDAEGGGHAARFTGAKAVCFCHELDHLNGVLISDHGVLQ